MQDKKITIPAAVGETLLSYAIYSYYSHPFTWEIRLISGDGVFTANVRVTAENGAHDLLARTSVWWLPRADYETPEAAIRDAELMCEGAVIADADVIVLRRKAR